MAKLSVCMQVHNEEKTLAECLEGLKFADEVVIALDKTTDRSGEIAREFGAKVIEGSWDLEGPRRDAAIDNASGDWILEVDCDERIPPELATEIRQVIETSPYDLHGVPFDNYIGDKLVRYGWGAYIGVSQKVALFRKGAKTHKPNGRVTHPEPVFNGTFGPVLKGRITHYMDKDLSDTFRRFNGYTTAGAKDLLAKGDIGTFWRNFLRLFSRFYKSYIRRKGYREGSLGFLIGMLAALYPMVSYIKAKYKL